MTVCLKKKAPGVLGLLFCLFLCGCPSPPVLTDGAFEKATLCAPAYDVDYNLLWKAALTAVQEVGFSPVDPYKSNQFIKTDMRVEKENLVDDKKIASTAYIFLERRDQSIGKAYILRICVPRFESSIKSENWTYINSDILMQRKIKKQFDVVLERLYRRGSK